VSTKLEYTGADFSVRVQPHSREAVSVLHRSQGIEVALDAERVGSKWEGLKVVIPPDLDNDNVARLVANLEVAFQAMSLEYVLIRLKKSEPVSEIDQNAALAELRKLGLNAEPSTDRTRVLLKKNVSLEHQDREANEERAQRMFSLIQNIHGTRPQYEILAKSKNL
jgi:hypothetical protein